jgi:rhombotail lipoprotein
MLPMWFPRRARLRIAACLVVIAFVFLGTGCVSSGPVCEYGCVGDQRSSTPLVDFLYPDGDVPAADGPVEIELPMVVGLAFLPSKDGRGPSATERDRLLTIVKERFRSVDYLRNIVVIPDYYFSRQRGRGFQDLGAIARLMGLGTVALVSYDQVSATRENKRSFAYLTIAGLFFVRGNEQTTHTLLDLAVIDPHSRTLLLRAGGTADASRSTTWIEQNAGLARQQEQGFDSAVTALNENFARELAAFEVRVREGTAPVRVRKTSAGGGGGALDGLQLLFLSVFAVALARAGLKRRKP